MMLAIRFAALFESSCSQTRNTYQPSAFRRVSVSRSRAMFARIFDRHHFAFAFGHVPCSGQPCQKHPSTKIATFKRRRVKSARRLEFGSGLSTRHRTPSARNSERSCASPEVSRRRVANIRRRAAADDAVGRSRRRFFALEEEVAAITLVVYRRYASQEVRDRHETAWSACTRTLNVATDFIESELACIAGV